MKNVVTDYTFNANAKTITLTSIATVEIERVYKIVNLTTNAIIYDVNNNIFTGFNLPEITIQNSNEIVFNADNANMQNSDKILIIYDFFFSGSVVNELPYVEVLTINDLPTAVNDVITLPNSGMLYYFFEIVDLAGKEIVFNNNVFRGVSQELAGLENAIVTINDTCTISDFRFTNCALTIDAPTGAYDWNRCNFYDCHNVLNVVNADNIVMETIGFINSHNFKISGTLASLVISPNCIFRSATDANAVYFTIKSTANITRRIRIQDSVFQTQNVNQKAIVFENGATLGIESLILKTVRFTGSGTALTGINGNDDRAFFFEVVGGNAINSTAIAQIYMKNNAVATDVVTQNVRYKIAGTFQSNPIAQRFTFDAVNNAMEYTSSVPRIFKIQMGFTVYPASGSNVVLGTYLGVKQSTEANFVPDTDRITESEVYVNVDSSARPASGFCQAIVELTQGDKVYVIGQNKSGTQDLVYEFVNLLIEKAAV